MGRIVFDDRNVAVFVIEEVGIDLSPDHVHTVGVVDKDGKPLGGVLFHGYTGVGGSILTHAAGNGRHWASRDFLWAVFDYAFGQMFVEKIFGFVPEDNLRALEVDLRLGFVIETKLKKAFHSKDMLVLSMTREQCKWLDHMPKTISPRFGTLIGVLLHGNGT